MNDDKIKALRVKLESSGLEKVKDNLRHNRYAPKWKISHIEDWIKENENPTSMCHETSKTSEVPMNLLITWSKPLKGVKSALDSCYRKDDAIRIYNINFITAYKGVKSTLDSC